MQSGFKVIKFIISVFKQDIYTYKTRGLSHVAPEIHGNRISGRKMYVLMGGSRRLKNKKSNPREH